MPQLNKISKNTTTVKYRDGYHTVTLHQTDIVKLNDDEIILNTGGWFTDQTRNRMNQVSNEHKLDYSVSFRKTGNVVHYKDEVHEFINNQVILNKCTRSVYYRKNKGEIMKIINADKMRNIYLAYTIDERFIHVEYLSEFYGISEKLGHRIIDKCIKRYATTSKKKPLSYDFLVSCMIGEIHQRFRLNEEGLKFWDDKYSESYKNEKFYIQEIGADYVNICSECHRVLRKVPFNHLERF